MMLRTFTLGLFLSLIGVAALADENQRAEALFETVFEEQVALSPMYQARLGRKTRYGEWNDISPAQEARYQALYKDQLQRLSGIDEGQLTSANRLNVRLLRFELEKDIAGYQWRDHNYPVNQMFGLHAGIPAFLINSHKISSTSDAEAYIARLTGVGKLIDQLIDNLQRRADKGILAPAFVYPFVLEDSRNIIKGQPFDRSKDLSPLLDDFTRKLDELELNKKQKTQLITRAKRELQKTVKPAYQRLMVCIEQLQKRADTRDGVWKLPEGEAFYDYTLQRMTTTSLNADEIHQIGLAEVARI